MGIEIRPVADSDFELIAGFLAALQDYEAALCPGLQDGMAVARDYASGVIKNVSQNDGLILLARCDGQDAGFVAGWMDRDEDMLVAANRREHALVSDLFVNESCRGKRVALALMDTFEREMRRRGARRLRVCAKAANLAAVKFYLGQDYNPYEIIFEKTLPPL